MPHFLSVANVLRLHEMSIERFGGSPGVRDAGLLESAVAMPQASYGGTYLHENLFAMTAAYLFHISQAHAFVDGNKRTALAAALTFATLNGVRMNAGDDDLIEICLGVAAGEIGKDELTRRLRAVLLLSRKKQRP